MSAGPIAQWRDGFKVPDASTRPSTAAHAVGQGSRGYCGRKGALVSDWKDVTCADCHAARRADEEAAR